MYFSYSGHLFSIKDEKLTILFPKQGNSCQVNFIVSRGFFLNLYSSNFILKSFCGLNIKWSYRIVYTYREWALMITYNECFTHDQYLTQLSEWLKVSLQNTVKLSKYKYLRYFPQGKGIIIRVKIYLQFNMQVYIYSSSELSSC